jgi:hypothetical protein
MTLICDGARVVRDWRCCALKPCERSMFQIFTVPASSTVAALSRGL